jgi:hypothetical protein
MLPPCLVFVSIPMLLLMVLNHCPLLHRQKEILDPLADSVLWKVEAIPVKLE